MKKNRRCVVTSMFYDVPSQSITVHRHVYGPPNHFHRIQYAATGNRVRRLLEIWEKYRIRGGRLDTRNWWSLTPNQIGWTLNHYREVFPRKDEA